VVVPTAPQVPDGPALRRVIVLPGVGVVPAVRVPERVKDWLAAGVVVLAVMVRVLAVIAATSPTEPSNETESMSAATAMIMSCFFVDTDTLRL